jgi:hypothetical protein
MFFSLITEMKLSPLGGGDLHGVADLLKPADEAVGILLGGSSVDVCGAQAVPFGAIARHVPGSGEHGCCDGDDGLFDTTTGAQPMALRLQVTALDLDLDRGPSRLHQCGFAPLATAVQPGTAPLARALDVARAHAGPGQQVGGRGETRHVDADLGDVYMGADSAQARHGAQQFGHLSKWLEPQANLLLDVGRGFIPCVDMVQVQLEREAVMRADAPAQGFEQFSPAGLDAGTDARGQTLGVCLTVEDGLQHRAPALAQDVVDHDTELEVGILQNLLDALRVRAPLAYELLAGAGKRAQLLHGNKRHEAGSDKTVAQQIGQPHRVVDVGLATGNVLQVCGVGQHQLGMTVEQVPRGLSVHAGGLHGYVLDAQRVEPVGQGQQQPRGGCGKRAHLLQHGAVGSNSCTGSHRLLVHVQTRTAGIDDCYDRPQCAATSACSPRHRTLKCALKVAKPQAIERGARGAAGPADMRVRGTKYKPTSLPDAAPVLLPCFMARGSRVTRWSN